MGKERNFKSISPSAKALMQFKAHTQIPFAKQTVKVLLNEDENTGALNKDFGFWASVVHFENRYYSVNELALEIPATNILELSSGFNYRGLEFTNSKPDIHYIDTDLPDIISYKKQIVSSFEKTHSTGRLDYEALNALDKKQFQAIVDRFNNRPLTIINEGLLVYLSKKEKSKLCRIIRTHLEKQQGYWITADIYLNHNPGRIGSDKGKKWDRFFSKQNVTNQMFESFEEAEEFFFNNGFVLDKEYIPDYSKLSASEKLLQVASPEQLDKLGKSGKVQATWRLKLE
ncbi:hypothetical protein ED312_13965 [Sinomicrobium pectinilyticum]|uniref:Class I SAM-dependent methyltransferase n=1 Tax=Sinomicrobium pectinilyticum TaxID=1084421 RepID=A0A3N0E8X8_SINP1|nr:hypothetical protein [Sinomicrobium pectinilyticum]RNL84283.1 hypothetical protein ED312_13965 [Sinomicrobium pectinilyticum]